MSNCELVDRSDATTRNQGLLNQRAAVQALARCDTAGVGNFYSLKFRNKLLEFILPFSYTLDAHVPSQRPRWVLHQQGSQKETEPAQLEQPWSRQ